MTTRIVISDLTRMAGGHVCVAGFDGDGRCVRLSTPRVREQTIVGAGHSLCVVSYAPAEVWKKSKAVHTLLDGVLASVTFR